MSSVIKLFRGKYSGGTIKLYNLFNLKNQDSVDAIKQVKKYKKHPKMFAKDEEIKYGKAPVIVACGKAAFRTLSAVELLKPVLAQYIAKSSSILRVAKGESGGRQYSIRRAKPDASGFIDSYHPSYTSKYGNSTDLGELN